MRRAAKRDGNETAIRLALEAAGCRVWPISSAGGPDLLVLSPWGRWCPLEIKNPAGRNRATARQAAISAPWPTIRTPQEALDLLSASKTGPEAG